MTDSKKKSSSKNKIAMIPTKKNGQKYSVADKAGCNAIKKKSIKKDKTEKEKYISKNVKNQNRKFTEDGLPIYTEKELGLGKGGDTELCPFDCDCCE